jgi:hypothetical protein
MNHEHLLVKYIRHVLDCEGTDFVHFSGYDKEEFTAEEQAELERLAALARTEFDAETWNKERDDT